MPFQAFFGGLATRDRGTLELGSLLWGTRFSSVALIKSKAMDFNSKLREYNRRYPHEPLFFAWVPPEHEHDISHPEFNKKWRAWNSQAYAEGQDGLQAFTNLLDKLSNL